MVAGVTIVGSILLLPTYLLALQEEQVQLNTIAKLKHEKDIRGATAIESELKTDQLILGLLEKSLSFERSSEAIGRVVIIRKDIHLTTLSHSILSSTTASVTIQGVAPTRTSLLSFKDRLESMLPGARADLPISGLAKSTNIPFSLQVFYSIP